MRQHLGHRGRNISIRWIWFSSSSPLSSPSVTSLSFLLRWRRATAIRPARARLPFKICFISDKSGGVWRGRTDSLREATWRPCDLQAVCRQVTIAWWRRWSSWWGMGNRWEDSWRRPSGCFWGFVGVERNERWTYVLHHVAFRYSDSPGKAVLQRQTADWFDGLVGCKFTPIINT